MMEIVPYDGWSKCARLTCCGQELFVTLDVGPRIIHFGQLGGENELHVDPKTAGKTGGDEYHSYGGHRLWVAPEDPLKVQQPDNESVAWRQEGDWTAFQSAPDKWHIQKEIWLRANARTGGFDLHHRIYNLGAYEVQLALWGLTVMAPGGEMVVPQAPYQSHTERLLPARPLVMWGYTNFTDPRFSIGKQLIRLRQTPDEAPNKFGMLIQQGWSAYANHGNLFMKRFGYDAGASYPDYGCNFESFTRHDMLEIESLGPLVRIRPGEFRSHDESWYLIPGFSRPSEEEALAAALDELVLERPLSSFTETASRKLASPSL